jgi:hypothetical protein
MLRESDLHLPKSGWGRIVLAASASRAGTAWTDHGTARQERGLKHRAVHETRTIPIPPELVKLLRAHSKRYGVAVLLKIYAHCIDGQADAANKRITDALGVQDTRPEPEPRDEGDDGSEQAS